MKVVSKISELFRDVVFAYVLGTGSVAEAFFIALRLPNLFRISQTSSAQTLSQQGAQSYINKMLVLVLVTSILLTLLIEILIPIVMYGLAPGFIKDGPKLRLAVLLSQLIFPYIILVSASRAINQGLRSAGRDISNLNLIIAHLCTAFIILLLDQYSHNIVYVLVLSILSAGMLQLTHSIINLHNTGIKIKLAGMQPSRDKNLSVMSPDTVLAHIPQLNAITSIILASFVPSGIAYLYYSYQLQQILAAILLAAIAPKKSMPLSTQKCIELGVLLGLPTAGMLAIIPDEIVSVLFAHGKFSGAQEVAKTLAAISIGLPAVIISEMLKDSIKNSELIKIYLKCLAFNIILSLLLIVPLKHIGIALGASISAWIGVFLIILQLEDRAMSLDKLGRMSSCCLLMLLAISVVSSLLQGLFRFHSLPMQLLGLLITIAAGAGTYLAALRLTKAYSRKN